MDPQPRGTFAVLQVVAVLIIDCPYALGLATLMSVMVDSSRAATSGVLFRDADAFETLRRVDVVIVDKTGTVTLGKPVCQIAEAVAPLRNKELQRLPASPG